MNKLELAKNAVAFTAGMGISQILTGIVSSTTPTDTTYQKVTVHTGRVVLGLVIGEAVDRYLDRKVIDVRDWWQENITTKTDSK
jgi:hypothetical protein